MRIGLTFAAMLAATPAAAQDYCPDRPGLGTWPCVIAPGKVSVETGLLSWERDDTDSERTDTILLADTLARIGVTEKVEVQLGWSPYGFVRTRDKAGGGVTTGEGIGDVSLGLKAMLAQPEGNGLALAVLPRVTLPVGGAAIGAGDWSASLLLPVAYDLDDILYLQLTPEIDAAVNASGSGRHLAYSATLGLGAAWAMFETTLEFQALRDDEPEGAQSQAFVAVSASWMPSPHWQLDIGFNGGLTAASPDARLYGGISHRFR
jgi:hypothetical protein